jgi:glycosyltransferase involved in cell wall biosynthesis
MERQFPFLAPLLRRIVRGSDAVTAISSYTAGRLARQVPGVRPAIIPFGAAVDAPAEPPPYEWDGTRPFELLFVGRLVERKGVHLLLDALASLPPERRPLLHVVGDGPERSRLEERARRLELGAGAVFHGFVAKDELQRRLATCDAFVLPAVVDAKGDTEGLGVVLIEAMGYARPVIASAAGGIVDIVEDGRSGFLVPPGDAPALADAVARLMEDPARARALGLQGREDAAARFSWDAIADRLAEIYRGVAR